MAQVITDCEVLLCGGMGAGAYHSMQVHGMRPIVINIAIIEDAVQQYLAGTLIDHCKRLH